MYSLQLVKELILDWSQPSSRNVGRAFESEVLSPREKGIVKLIAEGKSTKETAALLTISAHRR